MVFEAAADFLFSSKKNTAVQKNPFKIEKKTLFF